MESASEDVQWWRKGGGPRVSAATDREIAGGMLVRTEEIAARQAGRSIEDVRPTVARRIGIGVGSLANIRRQRRKEIPAWIMHSIRRVLVDVLQGEVRALEHEIHLALQAGLDHREDALAQAQAQMVEARKTLNEAVR